MVEVKSVRDIVSGLLGLLLIATAQFREPGWFLIIVALIPIGDALIVLRHARRHRRGPDCHRLSPAAQSSLKGAPLPSPIHCLSAAWKRRRRCRARSPVA